MRISDSVVKLSVVSGSKNEIVLGPVYLMPLNGFSVDDPGAARVPEAKPRMRRCVNGMLKDVELLSSMVARM